MVANNNDYGDSVAPMDQTYLGHTAYYWQDMATTVYMPWIILFVILVVAIRLINRKAYRRYRKSFELQEESIVRQKESLETFKNIQMTLQEISQKLDKR